MLTTLMKKSAQEIPFIRSLVMTQAASHFSTAAAAPTATKETKPPASGETNRKGQSNAFKSQHVRYIPKKRLRFDYSSPEGPLALIHHSSDAFYKRANNWKLSLSAALPAAALASFTLGP